MSNYCIEVSSIFRIINLGQDTKLRPNGKTDIDILSSVREPNGIR